ncbi:MAG: hypothetical protein JWM02_3665 [Frankiales bacterium]|nr:hypothetical protein [Frankiales bacterium]
MNKNASSPRRVSVSGARGSGKMCNAKAPRLRREALANRSPHRDCEGGLVSMMLPARTTSVRTPRRSSLWEVC